MYVSIMYFTRQLGFCPLITAINHESQSLRLIGFV